MGEVQVTAAFLNNFAGDNVRRLAQSFGVAGDHYGQMSVGHRWPYGPVGKHHAIVAHHFVISLLQQNFDILTYSCFSHVALITPFNFPLSSVSPAMPNPHLLISATTSAMGDDCDRSGNSAFEIIISEAGVKAAPNLPPGW